MEKNVSLPQIGTAVSAQVSRLDISSGEALLAGVAKIVAPLQEMMVYAHGQQRDLVAEAAAAVDTTVLRSINDRAVSVSVTLFAALRSVLMVQDICTDVRDAIAERALELSRQELFFSGMHCEIPLALLSVGSDGRREQSLFTDQDYLFLHGSGDGVSLQFEEASAEYFGMLGAVFADKMAEAGIPKCSGGIMPANEDWRGSLPQWQDRLTTLFRFERNDFEKNILNLIALMDTRFISGNKKLGLGFGKLVRSRVRENNQAIQQMARVVGAMKLSKGFLRRFIVEGEGIHTGEFNFKAMALMPLVMSLRLLAVNVGIEETSTVERIYRLQREGHLSEKMASGLDDAYHTFTRLRILQQMKRLKRIIDDDCYINPYELPGEEREELKNAIGRIEELQSMVRGRFAVISSVDRLLPS